MTAENPDHLDTRRWLAKARSRLRVPATHRDTSKWTVEDFKLAWLLRDQFTRAELLAILEIACGKRYDNRKGIDKFLGMMQKHIDGSGDQR